MSGKRVTKDHLLAALTSDMEVLAERMAVAVNKAQTGQALYGEGTAESIQWRQTHLETARNFGSLVLLDRLKDCQDGLQQDEHRQKIVRIEMILTSISCNISDITATATKWDLGCREEDGYRL